MRTVLAKFPSDLDQRTFAEYAMGILAEALVETSNSPHATRNTQAAQAPGV